MPQAFIDGPRKHRLAKADHIERIESDPVTWIHDPGDFDHCAQCRDEIVLNEGEHITVTLALGDYLHHRRTLVRVCSEQCYREWADEGMDVGW